MGPASTLAPSNRGNDGPVVGVDGDSDVDVDVVELVDGGRSIAGDRGPDRAGGSSIAARVGERVPSARPTIAAATRPTAATTAMMRTRGRAWSGRAGVVGTGWSGAIATFLVVGWLSSVNVDGASPSRGTAAPQVVQKSFSPSFACPRAQKI